MCRGEEEEEVEGVEQPVILKLSVILYQLIQLMVNVRLWKSSFQQKKNISREENVESDD